MTARRGETAALIALLLGLAGCAPPASRMLGDPAAGARTIARLDCGVCHTVPGIRGARGTIGPSLEAFARRAYLAGTAPNRPSVLVQWLRRAPSMAPDTLMPAMPISEREAQDVAAYLYTLE
jgi:mono/diheme cytochrome c family protein